MKIIDYTGTGVRTRGLGRVAPSNGGAYAGALAL